MSKETSNPSIQNKRWNLLPLPSAEEINNLSAQLNNLDKTLTAILIQRGIDTFEKAKEFFRPSLDLLHNPYLMKNMDEAVTAIIEAENNNKKILIYGDYDVDGTTSVSLVYSFLKKYFPNRIDYYIPDRHKEGYGISMQGIDYAADNDFSLVIALDCGIRAVKQMQYAKQKGVEFVICDHHLPGDELPEARAVLDPKQKDCKYPYKELSGCGVGFKLLQAYCEKKEIDKNELYQYFDFVAISIAADIVPLTGENRTLAALGLKKINKQPLPGVKSLINVSLKKKKLSISDLVFGLAPRINAAGRLGSAKNAVKTLIAETNDDGNVKANIIHTTNEERRGLDEEITRQALEMIEKYENHLLRKTSVVYNPDWHKGVVGIVASRLIETYYRPTIVFTKSEDGLITGSARSVKGYSVYDAINACSHLLEKFGGHKYAAGLSLKEENLEAFSRLFEQKVAETITPEMLIPKVVIDAKLSLSQITDRFYKILKQFAPFGPGNMQPVFLAENVLLKYPPRVLKEKHLKITVFQPENPMVMFDAIGFDFAEVADKIDEGVPFDIVFTVDENHWNGKVSLQLMIKDVKI
jgi:single-stranded-DNA-specific exonuclease